MAGRNATRQAVVGLLLLMLLVVVCRERRKKKTTTRLSQHQQEPRALMPLPLSLPRSIPLPLEEPGSITKSRRRGIRNLGNTCYLASLLQALSSCSRFHGRLRSISFSSSSAKIAGALRDVVSAVLDSRLGSTPVDPSGVFQALASSSCSSKVRALTDLRTRWHQHDPHEIFAGLVETLEEEAPLLFSDFKWTERTRISCQLHPERDSYVDAARYELFVPLRKESESVVEIQDLVDAWLQSEERIEAWKGCAACLEVGRSAMMKRSCFGTPPGLLLIRLLRETPHDQEKVHTRVSIADRVSFAGGGGNTTYRLRSTVHHLGHGRDHGHYVAVLAPSSASDDADDSYVLCNDQVVSPVTSSREHLESSVVMLFYENELVLN